MSAAGGGGGRVDRKQVMEGVCSLGGGFRQETGDGGCLQLGGGGGG